MDRGGVGRGGGGVGRGGGGVGGDGCVTGQGEEDVVERGLAQAPRHGDDAVGLQVASWLARRRGRRAPGLALSVAANALLGATGYLGGHMSYAQGVGVDTTVFEAGPEDWSAVADDATVTEGRPVAVEAGGVTEQVGVADAVLAGPGQGSDDGGPVRVLHQLGGDPGASPVSVAVKGRGQVLEPDGA